MATTVQEILDQTILHYHISERSPAEEEIKRAQKFGGVLIHLGCGELITLYDKWQQYHRELTDEPFAGHLVRSTANLGTDKDVDLDLLETALEAKLPLKFLGVKDPHQAQKIAENIATDLFKDVVGSAEMSIETIKASALAKLIATIAIEVSLPEQLLFEEREFFINGDPEDPQFLKEVYQRIQDDLDFARVEAESSEGYYTPYEDDDPLFNQTPAPILKISEDDKLLIARDYYRERFEEFSGEVTAVQAGRQLEKEASVFKYTYQVNY